MSEVSLFMIDNSLCDGCGQCLAACPFFSITINTEAKSAVIEASCSGCGLCLPACPQGAIAGPEAGPEQANVTTTAQLWVYVPWRILLESDRDSLDLNRCLAAVSASARAGMNEGHQVVVATVPPATGSRLPESAANRCYAAGAEGLLLLVPGEDWVWDQGAPRLEEAGTLGEAVILAAAMEQQRPAAVTLGDGENGIQVASYAGALVGSTVVNSALSLEIDSMGSVLRIERPVYQRRFTVGLDLPLGDCPVVIMDPVLHRRPASLQSRGTVLELDVRKPEFAGEKLVSSLMMWTSRALVGGARSPGMAQGPVGRRQQELAVARVVICAGGDLGPNQLEDLRSLALQRGAAFGIDSAAYEAGLGEREELISAQGGTRVAPEICFCFYAQGDPGLRAAIERSKVVCVFAATAEDDLVRAADHAIIAEEPGRAVQAFGSSDLFDFR